MIELIGNKKSGAGGQSLPFSPAVRAGDFVFVSGQVAMDANGEIVPGGIEIQAAKTLDNIQAVLALADCTLQDVAKVNVWLDDSRDFWTFNRIYAKYFGDHAPARSTVCSKLVVDAKIEMDVIAYKPK